MVKLLVLSDLHVEFAAFVPDGEAAAAADVVVLAYVPWPCERSYPERIRQHGRFRAPVFKP